MFKLKLLQRLYVLVRFNVFFLRKRFSFERIFCLKKADARFTKIFEANS